MGKFGHIEKQKVSDANIVDYPLDQIHGGYVLHLASATAVNKPFYNALLKKSATAGKRAKKQKVTAAQTDANRNDDRQLYAKHVISGWTGVEDSDGKPVKFNESDCLEFLQALDDWIFDEIRAFCSDAGNFQEDEIDTEATAKN